MQEIILVCTHYEDGYDFVIADPLTGELTAMYIRADQITEVDLYPLIHALVGPDDEAFFDVADLLSHMLYPNTILEKTNENNQDYPRHKCRRYSKTLRVRCPNSIWQREFYSTFSQK